MAHFGDQSWICYDVSNHMNVTPQACSTKSQMLIASRPHVWHWKFTEMCHFFHSPSFFLSWCHDDTSIDNDCLLVYWLLMTPFSLPLAVLLPVLSLFLYLIFAPGFSVLFAATASQWALLAEAFASIAAWCSAGLIFFRLLGRTLLKEEEETSSSITPSSCCDESCSVSDSRPSPEQSP